MFRKTSVILALVAFAFIRAEASTSFNANGVVYGTSADCNACAKCYRDDGATSSLDSTCGEVKTGVTYVRFPALS